MSKWMMVFFVMFAFQVNAEVTPAAAPAAASSNKANEPARKPKKGLVDEMSGQGYGMGGCGLGSILFGEREGMVQIFASTTNGVYGNQTFAMTSGTSNCAPDEKDSEKTAKVFIESNRKNLETDMARGSGETLANFSGVMGCQNSSQFSVTMKKNYQNIFPSSHVSDEKVLENIQQTIRNNQALSQNCEG